MTDRIDELFARLYTEAIYSSSASATKRDMNDDLECIEAALAEAIAERDALRAASEWLADKWCYDADPAECGCGVDYTPESCLQAAKEATK